MPHSSSPRWWLNPYLLLTLTALFWSGNMVIARAINILPNHAPIPPMSLALGRWLIVLALCGPLAWPHRHQWPLLAQNWKTILVLSLTGITFYNSFAYIGLQYTTATNAVLLNSFIPMVTVLLGWLFLKRTVTPRQSMGIFISFVGVMVIVSRGDGQVFLHFSINRGDVWILLAVMDWAIYTVVVQSMVRVHPMLTMAVMTLIGTLALLPFTLYEWWHTPNQSAITWDGINLAVVLYVGLFPGFLGYVFYNRSIREIGANRGALFIHLMPVFGTLLSVVFLGERLYLFHWVGIVAIFVGLAMTVYQRHT